MSIGRLRRRKEVCWSLVTHFRGWLVIQGSGSRDDYSQGWRCCGILYDLVYQNPSSWSLMYIFGDTMFVLSTDSTIGLSTSGLS